MATFFKMPKLGINMTEGRIVSWNVPEGTKIKKGDILIEIETDKAINEVEAPASGILAKILHDKDEDVPCNEILAIILEEGEDIPDNIDSIIDEKTNPIGIERFEEKGRIFEDINTINLAEIKKRIRISPSARKLAEELGIGIESIVPSGKQIKREDVLRAFKLISASKQTKPNMLIKTNYSGIRKRIGDAMATSATVTASVALYLEADAEGLIRTKDNFTASSGKISYDILLAKIVAEALIEFPYMNSQLSGNEILDFEDVNIGIAVDNEKGLFVPVLKNANNTSLENLNSKFTELTSKIKTGKISQEDLEGGTFTITNLGAQKIEFFTPIINYPQCAILGVGAIIPKVVSKNGKILVRQIIGLTLVFDHRIVDGAPAARFLEKIKFLIEAME